MKKSNPPATDIMGREQCSSTMPCLVCRAFNKAIPCLPKEWRLKQLRNYDI